MVTRAQLLVAGLTAREIDRRVDAGRLMVLRRGTYAVGHTALGIRGHARAALLACGPGAALSHRTAASWWGLAAVDAIVDVTVGGAARRSTSGIRVHRTATLDAVDLRRRDGVRLTAPARTIVDFAAAATEAEVDHAIAEAQVSRLLRIPELDAAVAARPRHRGAALVRRLLDAGAPPTRSELERRLRALVRDAGLPAPEINHPVGRFEADAVWLDAQVVVETDGWAAHGHRRAFERDRARDAELAALGYVVVRFTWRQLRDEPVRVASRLAQVLARRGA